MVSVILRPVYWQDTPLGQLQVLPKGGQPVTQWADPDAAFENVVQGMAQHFVNGGLGRHEALATAYARIYQSVQAQAGTLAYIDTFMVLAVAAGIMFLLSFMLKKNDPGGGMHVAE